MILAIFSPIFILYPIAEIEVLMRKEILITLEVLRTQSTNLMQPFPLQRLVKMMFLVLALKIT